MAKKKRKKQHKPKQPKSVKAFLVPRLRSLSRWWHPKNEARKLAKVIIQVGIYKNGNPRFETKYKCGICSKLCDIHEGNIDHKIGVVSSEGFKDWNEYIERLFCGVDNLWHICRSCHDIKTKLETEERKKNREIKKTIKK